jgi:inner membrane protein
MDNLTHTLTGLALSRAGLNRICPRPLIVLLLAANIPDVDVITAVGGRLVYFANHRGITHAIPFLPAMAAIPVLIAMLFARSWKGWLGAYVASCIGVASHLLLDWTNAYGVRLLLPFSNTWFRADLNNIVDLWIWAVLLLAALAPLLGGLVSSEIGAKPGKGRGVAIFALVCVVGYDFGRFLMHQRAIESMDAHIYDGAPSQSTVAFPSAANPFRWTGWVNTEREAIRFDVNLLSPFDPTAGSRVFKPQPSPAIEAAKDTQPFRVFINFDQCPLWVVEPADSPPGATRVELHDERFPFVAAAVVDKSLRVLDSDFRF